MTAQIFAITLMAALWVGIVALNERYGLLSCDRFPSKWAKAFAYVWLGAFLILLGVLVAGAATRPARAEDLAKAPFYALFSLHAILIVFLLGWWLATGRPGVAEFFNLQKGHTGQSILIGLGVGVAGWVFTLAAALTIAMLLQAVGLLDGAPEPSPVIGFMASLPAWKKALIVLSAMTVEELFFRAWLQKRIGLILSTTFFAMAHFTLGQPLLLIGVTMISLVIGYTFYRTRNVLPGIIAHGVFDVIQLFVILPIAFRITGG